MYLVLRFLILTNPEGGVGPDFGGFFKRLIYLPNHIFSFVKLAIAPVDLNLDYVFSYPQHFFEISNLVGLVIIVGLVVFSFFTYQHFRDIFFGIWWFLITLSPVYNLIEIINPLAERYLYIPIIGFCVLLMGIFYRLLSKILDRTLYVRIATLIVVIVVSGACATVVVERNRDWRDDFTLWSKTVMQSPNSGIAHVGLGRALHERGQLDEAIDEFQKALKIMPNHFRAYYMLGVLYDQKGDFEKAIANLKKSIDINPLFPDSHYNVALLYHKKGMIDEAIRHYRKVIELVPEDFEARNNLGVAFATKGNLEQALLEWRKVLEIDPSNTSAQDNIAKAKALQEESN
jgi:tetratricopeptide (TPR) repeat protein